MLILICPSETQLEEDKIWIGNQSSSLSQNALQRAAEIGSTDPIANDRAYVAPQEQFQQFAKIILTNPFETVAALTDRSMGTLTGRSYRETLGEFPRRNWLAWQRSYFTAPPAGESFFDISDRIRTVFRTKILPVKSNETVAVICPADVMKIIIGHLTKIEEAEIPKIEIQSSVPYVINGDLECK